MPAPSSNTWCAARAAHGAGLIAVAACARGGRGNARLRTVAAALGARQLAQAALTAGHPPATTLMVGAEVDLAHALSMLGLAVFDQPHRRPALADAAIALGWATTGMLSARRAPGPGRTDHTPSPVLRRLRRNRDRLAAYVAARTVPRALRANSGGGGGRD